MEPASGAFDVFDRASKGEEAAIATVERVADYLALLCLTICRVVDPTVIILGGGMSKAANQLIPVVQRKMLERSWTILPTNVRFVVSETPQEQAGIIGAALSVVPQITPLSTPATPAQAEAVVLSQVCSVVSQF